MLTRIDCSLSLLIIIDFLAAINAAPPVEDFLDLHCHKACLQPHAKLTYEQLFCKRKEAAHTTLRSCNRRCLKQQHMEDHMFDHAYQAVCVESPPNSEPRRRKIDTLISDIAASNGYAMQRAQSASESQSSSFQHSSVSVNGGPPVVHSKTVKQTALSQNGGKPVVNTVVMESGGGDGGFSGSNSKTSFSSSSSSSSKSGDSGFSSISKSSSSGSGSSSRSNSNGGIVRTSSTSTGPNAETIEKVVIKNSNGGGDGGDGGDGDGDGFGGAGFSGAGFGGGAGFGFGGNFGGVGDLFKQISNKAKQTFGFQNHQVADDPDLDLDDSEELVID